jgi:hypothetical protein
MNRTSFLTLLIVGIFVGCANPYRANFNSTSDRHPAWVERRLAPPSASPRIITSNNIKNDNWDLFEKGYIMVGYSKFDGPHADPTLAVAEAKRIGADIILIEQKFARSLTETVTMTQWAPSETTEIRENWSEVGANGVTNTQRRMDVTTNRGPETVYVPKQVDYYEHSATYWRKLQWPIFGAFVQDLTDELKQRLETNQGLTVRAIVNDSPAYRADLLKGDILLSMNGQPVPGAQRFYEEISNLAGKTVEFTVLRGNKRLQRTIPLNP